MKYDGVIDLAVGMSVKSKIWKNKKFQWSELVAKLAEETRTNETYKEYIAATKEEQLKIKDVGGFVGGYLRAGRRNPGNVVHRQLLTLDMDFAHLDFWGDFQLHFENAAVLHATHKHHKDSPRFRLIIPLSRETTPDEYVAVARQVAGVLGIDLFDNTTFETNRLMFWPSSPKDVEYYFEKQDGPWVDVDEVLSTYTDWTDSSLWPVSSTHTQKIQTSAVKQEDPENKKGIIGAFCRTYSISEVVETYLPEEYTPAGEDRFTYSKGSTAAGLIVYEDKFAYSHHGTDPTGGKLCNAFDLVRLHKFGHLDEGSESSGHKTKSFKAMEDLARADSKVRKIIAAENIQEAKYDFADEPEDFREDDISWMAELEVDGRGKYLSSANNINLIFSSDIRFKGLFRRNEFDSKNYIFGNLPWRRVPGPEPVRNVDYSGVRNYVESIYGITGSQKIEDVLNLEFERNSYHPVRNYLKSLKWDGTPRIDTLLIDYFGADDNLYVREAIRKKLVGGVARVMHPGIKFDLVLVLSGEQGTGKSTFIKKLGREWFSDTFTTVQGKEAMEQIQGAWLIEIAELSGLKKAEVETTKHFLGKSKDDFRPAYGRTLETFLRQCIFFGTTNRKGFLKDPTGNRRFLPVDVVAPRATKSVWDDLNEAEVDQIWAEAFMLFRKRENLTLSDGAEAIARSEQRTHSEFDEREGIIEEYLERYLPTNWDDMDVMDRRNFLSDPLAGPKGSVYREEVCVAEVWCECFGKEREDMDRYKTRDINDMLRSMEGWEPVNSTKNFKLYGKQKYYVRKID